MKKRGLRVFLAALLLLALLAGLAPAVFASNAYTINGVVVHYDDFTSAPLQCWTYANNIYNKIWKQSFTWEFGSADNALRKLSDADLRLTAVHLKDYVSKAALGACIRVCYEPNLHSHDGEVVKNLSPGHNLIIVQKDANGFTAFEGGLNGYPYPYCREKYYTWSSFVQEKGYTYIKYIKWPGATAYTPPAPHTCDLSGGYAFVEDVHPHYKCYYCSVCGVAQRNYKEPTTRAGCLECNRPATPALLDMKAVYHPGETVTFTWKPTANTTHYNIYLDKKDENGEYQRLESQFYVNSGLTRTLEEGSYRIRLQSTNKNYYEADGKNWLYKNAEWVEFDVAHSYEPVVSPPDCTTGGYTIYFCEVCDNKYVADETAPLDHDWGAPSYVWADDNRSVTAARTCKRDAAHVESETAAAVSVVTKEATYDTEGEITCTATFKNAAFAAQTKVVKTSKLEGGLPCDGGTSCPGKVFADMPAKGHWAHDPIDWAISKNITNGTSATTFGPDEGCTRAQVVTFLWRAAGKPEPTSSVNPFADVKSGEYYYDAVLWAVEKGITNGTAATAFSPNATCTRAQIVTFLWRFAGKPTPVSQNNPFSDVKTSEYYGTAVLWAVENGITNGTSATTFSPNDTCTRAQVVTFLYRDMKK